VSDEQLQGVEAALLDITSPQARRENKKAGPKAQPGGQSMAAEEGATVGDQAQSLTYAFQGEAGIGVACHVDLHKAIRIATFVEALLRRIPTQNYLVQRMVLHAVSMNHRRNLQGPELLAFGKAPLARPLLT